MRVLFAMLALVYANAFATESGLLLDETRDIDVEAGPLEPALAKFYEQTRLQLSYDDIDFEGLEASRVVGRLRVGVALEQLLAGSGLTFSDVNGRVVAIYRRREGKRLPTVTIQGQSESSIVVTGARALHPGSDLVEVVVDRQAGSVVDVITTLPQVFGGGPSEDTHSNGFEAQGNFSRGAGINLRGLGAGSVLTMINGQRLAGAGSDGVFADISLLPPSIFERIEILSGRTPTPYGADAVGGTVNFVTRERVNGAETQVTYGASTRGGVHELHVSQLAGPTTASGGFVAFDYYTRDRLRAADWPLARSDLRVFNGTNFNVPFGNPGTINAGSLTWAIPAGQNGTALDRSALIPSTMNLEERLAGADLLPDQEQYSAFATFPFLFGADTHVSFDLLGSERTMRYTGPGLRYNIPVPASNAFYVNPLGLTNGPVFVGYNFGDDLGPLQDLARVSAVLAAGRFRTTLGSAWTLRGSLSSARQAERRSQDNVFDSTALSNALADSDPASAFNPFGDGSHTNPATLARIRTTARSTSSFRVDAVRFMAQGPLLDLPSGSLALALGGEYRRHLFASTTQRSESTEPFGYALTRVVRSVFAELCIPVHTKASLSLGARNERYSDVGNTIVPQYGLDWRLSHNVRVNVTRSVALRPPNPADMMEYQNSAFLAPLDAPFDPSKSMQSPRPVTALLWSGKNASMREERARNWTLGAEIMPAGVPGLAVALAVFHIDFRDRMRVPQFTPDVLTHPRYASLVTWDPSPEQRQNVCDRSPMSSLRQACLTVPIEAIVDLRVRNEASVWTRGVDLNAGYKRDLRGAQLALGLSGTYVLSYAEAQGPSFPRVERVSTQNSPIDLRLRAKAEVSRGPWEGFAIAYYSDDYRDTLSRRRVRSWTTLDLGMSYRIGHTTVSLNAENVFDSDPPFLNNAVGIGYDEENANPTLRTLRLTLRKQW